MIGPLARVLATAAYCAAALTFCGPAVAQEPDIMVSLGDSYSSGEGSRNKVNKDWDKNAGGKNGCHRGPNAWPRRLGVIAGWHFACTGAVIDNVLSRGQKAHKPDNFPQLSRLKELDGEVEIDAVLITIGGNDIGFAGKITACFFGHKCLRDLDKIDDELDDLKVDLVAAYGEIADSTWGDLIVVGYPDIFPDRDEKDEFHKCGWLGENKKRGTAEKTGVWHLQDGLERTIREAAEEADVDFISIREALDGREMCTKKSVINKITPTGKDRVHPNATGQKLIAETVRAGLDELYGDDAAAAAAARPRALAAARWRSCGDVTFAPNSEYGASNIRAKRVRCRKARRVARASKEMNVVSGPFEYKVGGFRCVGTPVDQPLPRVDWTCTRKRARVTFTRT